MPAANPVDKRTEKTFIQNDFKKLIEKTPETNFEFNMNIHKNTTQAAHTETYLFVWFDSIIHIRNNIKFSE